MLDLNDLRLFVHVVESRGVINAARALGLPKSTVSRRIAALERQLGAALLKRGGGRIALTELGEELYRRGIGVTAAALAAEEVAATQRREPAGRVRLSASIALGQLVLPDVVARFAARHPEVRLSLEIANRPADSTSGDFDVLLRVHTWPLNDSALLQRRLCTVPVMTVASPDYLARAGRVARVADLAAHDLLTFGFEQPQTSWTLADARGRQHSVSFRPKLQASDVVMLKLLVLRGLGIAQLSHLLCNADVAAGRLVEVLPKYRAEAGVLSLLCPTRRGMGSAVRALVDFLIVELPRTVEALQRPNGGG